MFPWLQVFPIAKELADCVIPAEYGITAAYKLRIAEKIAAELIGKLLLDLETSRQASEGAAYDATGTESIAQASEVPLAEGTRVHGTGDDALEHPAGEGEVVLN